MHYQSICIIYRAKMELREEVLDRIISIMRELKKNNGDQKDYICYKYEPELQQVINNFDLITAVKLMAQIYYETHFIEDTHIYEHARQYYYEIMYIIKKNDTLCKNNKRTTTYYFLESYV